MHRVELMEGEEAQAGSRACYHGASTDPSLTLAAVCPVVGELVPVSGVTVTFAATMFVLGMVMMFVLSVAYHRWRHRDDL